MNRLWNEHHANWQEARWAYRGFFETDSYRFVRNANAFRALKLMSDQYLVHRRACQANTSFLDLAKWLTNNQDKLFLAPLIYANHLKVDRFTELEFDTIKWHDDLTHKFQFPIFEQDIDGPGWHGELKIYIPYTTRPYQTTALKTALASFGIFTTGLLFNNDKRGRFLDVEFIMFSQDFPIKWDANTWRTDTNDEDDDIDEFVGPDMDRLDRIKMIEEGLLDDEDPRL